MWEGWTEYLPTFPGVNIERVEHLTQKGFRCYFKPFHNVIFGVETMLFDVTHIGCPFMLFWQLHTGFTLRSWDFMILVVFVIIKQSQGMCDASLGL